MLGQMYLETLEVNLEISGADLDTCEGDLETVFDLTVIIVLVIVTCTEPLPHGSKLAA